VAAKTIMRIEAVVGVPQSRTGTLLAIEAALKAAGIEFIGTPEEGPGIRLWLGKGHTP
jgi:hypothetical protein